MDQAKSLQEAYLGPSPVLSLYIICTHGVPRGGSWGKSWGESRWELSTLNGAH